MATLAAVVMPKWGMEMTEGEIAEWHVGVGDAVKANADLVDVETAKIVNTVSASSAGNVVRLCASVGDVVPVGGLLAVIAEGAASEADIDAFIGEKQGAGTKPPQSQPEPQAPPTSATVQASRGTDSATAAPAAAPPGEQSSKPLSAGDDDSAVPASPVARRVAAASNINLNNVTATGRHGRVSLEDIRAAAEAAGATLVTPEHRTFESPPADDHDLKATPVARRLAAKLGVNLRDCRRTGRHQRISKADVEAAAARNGTASTAPAATVGTATTRSDSITSEAITGTRKTIARRVSQAKREVPHFRVNIEVDVAPALALRSTLNASDPGIRVSLNDILVRACAGALERNPALNARFDGEVLEQHSQCHIASAVAVDNGVMMPVVKDVASLGLVALSTTLRDLATRAKTGRLTLDELDGGTFGISNLGMFGIDSFDAIINQPQVAILAVGTAEERPVVRNGTLTTGHTMRLSLASDHRVVDGADAARFLADLKTLLEQPALMLG